MAKRIIWTEPAYADLRKIREYIAQDSPRNARRFISVLRQSVRSLSRFPRRGEVVGELKEQQIRATVTGNYRIFHQVRPDAVYILRVIHAARDFPAVWHEKD